MMARRIGLILCLMLAGGLPAGANLSYSLAVLPPEHRVIKDPLTGAEVLFVTTHRAPDHNLYFHQRSFLSDNSALLFRSGRSGGGLMAYLFGTGELVEMVTPRGSLQGVTAAREGNRVFGYRGRQVLEWAINMSLSADPQRTPSQVTATERVIATIPENMVTQTDVNENSDGTLLAVGVDWLDSGERGIATVNIHTGEVREVCRVNHAGHIEFSHGSPYLLSFAGLQDRLWVVDVREGQPRCIHPQAEGEYVTHECWWLGDMLTFCGGFRDKESHVKVIDALTGEVRIVGAGAWVPWRDPGDDILNRWNWWHAAGYEGGRWIVADNWYGDIVLFDAKTTQMRRLAVGHRKYAPGEHPEPGWDRTGTKVVFNSQMLGGLDVCVATIPDEWQADPADEGYLLTSTSREW